MKNLFISIDVEPDIHRGSYDSLRAIWKIRKLLKKYKVKATLFTTCDCIKKDPKLFQQFKKDGHEISLHGYEHKRFDVMSRTEKEENLDKSIKCFKKYLKIKPLGFRGPQHSADKETIRLLIKKGFLYDSSLAPWNFYHLLFFWKIKIDFKDNFMPLRTHVRHGLLEIPITSFILPFSSLTFRILPKPLLNLYFRFISVFENPVFLMHSWDLIEMPYSKIYRLGPLDKFLDKFEYMLNYYFSKKKYFANIEEICTQ